ncbi:hypothetical protein SBF1_7670003 [Candidatus Desulfosporosinus infrequens]|uniref:Uncharacterized protein n=1 Tax=Candidatus Desulfosporosinus infrequens TaxID=2043169 RepID=A0A2U3LRM3_9FIRM|nr:hypothetical protein SBF1_7670003 [Candidatus Desulfosporosinus infrequens]
MGTKISFTRKFKQRTRTLLTGPLSAGRQRSGLTLKLFNYWVENLTNSEEVLREFDQAGKTLVPSGEWLLDNIHFIKEQALFVQQKLSKNNLHKLPMVMEEPQDVRIFRPNGWTCQGSKNSGLYHGTSDCNRAQNE